MTPERKEKKKKKKRKGKGALACRQFSLSFLASLRCRCVRIPRKTGEARFLLFFSLYTHVRIYIYIHTYKLYIRINKEEEKKTEKWKKIAGNI